MADIEIGYMPDYREDLLEAIEFARAGFDFIELTVFPNNKDAFLQEDVRKNLQGFPVMGHVHWRHDLVSLWQAGNLAQIIEEIEIFSQLKARYITLHPQSLAQAETEEVIAWNRQALTAITRRFDLVLIENTTTPPFDDFSAIKSLLETGVAGVTADFGHLIKRGKSPSVFNESLGPAIKHFHLHAASSDKDHVAFKNEKELCEMAAEAARTRKKPSFTLEIFRQHDGTDFPSIQARKEYLLSCCQALKCY